MSKNKMAFRSVEAAVLLAYRQRGELRFDFAPAPAGVEVLKEWKGERCWSGTFSGPFSSTPTWGERKGHQESAFEEAICVRGDSNAETYFACSKEDSLEIRALRKTVKYYVSCGQYQEK